MAKALLFLLTMVLLPLTIRATNDFAVPMPKEMRTGPAAELPAAWKIQGDCRAAGWLREELERFFHWNIDSGASAILSFEPLAGQSDNPETYELEIGNGKIRIGAMTETGFFRAVGRLLALLKTASTPLPGGRLSVPAVKITDRPDTPVRSMHLMMYYPIGSETAEKLAYHTIDAMAELGFNMVVLAVGGNYSSPGYHRVEPGMLRGKKPDWSAESLRKLAEYAKSRGLTPIPSVNVIGHTEGSCNLFPLKDRTGKVIGNDVKNPRFFEEYFAALDELLDLYGNPPFFMAGGDECDHVLAVMEPEKENQFRLYCDVFNRIAAHLKKRDCRPIIWNDMLLYYGLGRKYVYESGNPKPLSGRAVEGLRDKLKMLSPEIIVASAHYKKEDPLWKTMEIIKQSGLDYWVTPWYEPENIRSLVSYGSRHGMSGVMGSTWAVFYQRYAEAFTLTAESAWNNRTAKISGDPAAVFNRLFAGFDSFPPTGAKPFALEGGVPGGETPEMLKPVLGGITPVRAGSVSERELSISETPSFSKQNPDALILIRGTRSGRESRILEHFNCPRDGGMGVLYTPQFGKSTQTNPWGTDYVIQNGVITRVVTGKPDTAIPAGKNSAVLSEHGSLMGLPHTAWVYQNLTEGTRVELVAATVKNGGKTAELSARLPEDTKGVLLYFEAARRFYGKNYSPLEIGIIFADGSEQKFRLGGDYESVAVSGGAFSYGRISDTARTDSPLYGLRWENRDHRKVSTLKIAVNPIGIAQEMTIYGGMEW